MKRCQWIEKILGNEMIALNAFITYILTPARNLKIVIAAIMILALVVRRSNFFGLLYLKFTRMPLRMTLTIILVIAFLFRLLWILWSPHTPPAPISEDLLILNHARDLVAGKGFISFWTREPTAFRPAGYPLFLSLLFRMAGENLFLAEFVQVIFGVLSVFLIFAITRRTLSERVAFFAALLYACYPTAIMSTKILLDEHPFMLFWFLGIVLLISDYQTPAFWKIVLAGLAIGISAVCRPYSTTMCGVAFFVWWIGKKNFMEGLKKGVIIGVLTVLCALPWAIRNYYRLGAPIFWTTAIGTNMYFANNPTSDVRYPVNPDPQHGGDPDFLNPNNTEIQKDRAGRRAAFRWIVQNPGIFFQKAAGRAFYMLGLDREGWVIDDNFTTVKAGAKRPKEKFLNRLGKFESTYYVIIFLFALVGLAIYCRDFFISADSKGFIYIVMTLVFYILVTAVSLAHRKYRLVIEPFFCILGAYGFLHAFFGYAAKKSSNSTRDA